MSGRPPSDRGQAYTLESLIAALLLVTAVLFALQSGVLTSDSAGSPGPDVRSNVYQEASDVLVTAANDGELSSLARHWDCSAGSAGFATSDRAGVWTAGEGYSEDTVPPPQLGETLNRTFDEGVRYNLWLLYENEGAQNRTRIVQQGSPSPDVVTASYTLTLTDGQQVTAQNETATTLAGCDDPPIPEAHEGSSVYNVVEVRLVLW